MKYCGTLVLIVMGVSLISQVAIAEETTGEKIETSANNVKRNIKRKAHKIDESLCNKGKTKCVGKQIENRATELKDATVDGIKDIKNKVN